jgi:signal transduction histidine kinase
LAEAHGGRVGVRSVDGRGADFWFEIPKFGERQATRQE